MTKRQITRRIAVAVSVVAFAAVPASAQADPPPHGLPDGYVFEDFVPGTEGAGETGAPVRPDDRADRFTPGEASVAKQPADGIDWIDAGIGAATAFGLVLLAAGTWVVVLRHRRVATFS